MKIKVTIGLVRRKEPIGEFENLGRAMENLKREVKKAFLDDLERVRKFISKKVRGNITSLTP